MKILLYTDNVNNAVQDYKSFNAANCLSISSSAAPLFEDSPRAPLWADGASAN